MNLPEKLIRGIIDIDFGGTAGDNEGVPDWTPENNSLQSTLHQDPYWNGHLERPPFPGCLQTLVLLAENGYPSPGVVSKITMRPLIETKIRRWFTHHGFDSVISQKLIRFCANWEDKVELCLKRGTTHFVDNQLKPLAPMVGKIPHLYLFRPPPRGRDKNLWHLVEKGQVTLVDSWEEIGWKILNM